MREESRRDSESRAYVLDTNALLLGFSGVKNLYTTEEAIKEVKYDELQVARLEAMLTSGALKIARPTTEAIEKVKESAGKQLDKLSQTDLTILAAALDLTKTHKKVIIVTDDYTIQQLTTKLQLNFIPLKHSGIRKTR
ncbi:MAG: hypothetical protein QW580_01490 [Nitrososphaerota archaeon]